jgi:hypothetical protein
MFIIRNYLNNLRSTKVVSLFNLDQIWSMKDRDSETIALFNKYSQVR